MVPRSIALSLVALLWATLAAGAARAGTDFPFHIPFDGLAAGTAPADLAALPAPAGAGGFVRVVGDRFTLSETGERIRFWGTNLCFGGCFPPHEVADRMARRLASLGINCVRFHHMDANGYPRGIWSAEDAWGDFRHAELHPEALDRLDYLVCRLKEHGIYVNFNLHVSRTYGPEDGFPAAREGQSVPRYGKGVDHFYPECIEEQKRYARMLLDRKNPYTGNRYADEPAVAMVEISNEDSLLFEWHYGHLQDLPGPYAEELERQWNVWLQGEYDTTEALRAAWARGEVSGGEADLLAAPEVRRQFGVQGGAEADVEQIHHPDGRPARLVTVRRASDTLWHVQHAWSPIAVSAGTAYVVQISLRANRPETVSVNCMMSHEPWRHLGLTRQVQVGPQWRTHRLFFRASESDAPGEDGSGGARITLSGLSREDFQIAFTRPILRKAAVRGLLAGEVLGAVGWPGRDLRGRTRAARVDVVRFLRDTEAGYWADMRRYLVGDLGIRAPVTGTAVGFTTTYVAAGTGDFVDAHAYWRHPHFPGRPWDRDNWVVRNDPMVANPGGSTVASLAGRRVFGKPFTVTEYNHPQPHRYAAEGFPLIAAYGSLQAWDGLFEFAYSHNETWETDHFSSFFDMKANPVKLAQMPACSAIFRGGLVAAGHPAKPARMAAQERIEHLLTGGPRGINTYTAGAPPDGWRRRPVGLGEPPAAGGAPDGAQVEWEAAGDEGRATFVAERAAGIVGFVADRTLEAGGLRIRIGRSARDGFAVVLLNAVDGQALGEPGRYLVTAASGCYNSEMGWNEARNSVGRQWGRAPTLNEPVPFSLTAHASEAGVRLFALARDGTRRAGLEPAARGGGSVMYRVGAAERTLWYELVLP